MPDGDPVGLPWARIAVIARYALGGGDVGAPRRAHRDRGHRCDREPAVGVAERSRAARERLDRRRVAAFGKAERLADRPDPAEEDAAVVEVGHVGADHEVIATQAELRIVVEQLSGLDLGPTPAAIEVGGIGGLRPADEDPVGLALIAQHYVEEAGTRRVPGDLRIDDRCELRTPELARVALR